MNNSNIKSLSWIAKSIRLKDATWNTNKQPYATTYATRNQMWNKRESSQEIIRLEIIRLEIIREKFIVCNHQGWISQNIQHIKEYYRLYIIALNGDTM